MALHYGGFNIFGRNFGNYNQDIQMDLIYENKIDVEI